jgi:death-on-curing protein
MKAAALLESVMRFHPLVGRQQRYCLDFAFLMLWINYCRHDFSTDAGLNSLWVSRS